MTLKLFFVIILLSNTVELSNIKSLENLAQNLDNFFEENFNFIFKRNKIDELLLQLYNDKVFQTLPLNYSKIVEDFSSQLSKELHKKMKALKKTVLYAETVASEFYRDPNIKPENVTYINSKKITANDSRLKENSLFKTPVISNQSSVHIPTEIYDGDPVILNDIKYLTLLNPAFRANNKELRYQYFASTNGLVVHYPGMQWRKSGVDMYDVRRRQWYVQGASSSKDVMVLIDTSGSMHGIAITLTKIAVQKLIDTMGENDYVSVAQFPGLRETEKDKFPPHLLANNPYDCEHKNVCSTCFNTFVQASKRNKDQIFKQINKLKAKGRSFLNEALIFAIKQFQMFDKLKVNMEHEGGNCNRVIVVLTDGDGEYDLEQIRKYAEMSPLTSHIKIFIYSVGEDVAPNTVLRNITCDYQGYFGHIRSYGAVSNIIEAFSKIAHKHIVDQNFSSEFGADNWFKQDLTSVWDDGFLNPHDFPKPGLGLMTSLTMPVYNRTGNVTFLGLLGTDMTVAFMQDLVPNFKLGPNGYAFAINTNGFTIFHPELKVQRGWMPDPPNVDITEIEFNSDEKTNLRRLIIDAAASNKSVMTQKKIPGLIKVSDEIHTYERTRLYAFSGVPFSTFGISIVVPLYNKNYMKIHDDVGIQKPANCSPLKCPLTIKLSNNATKTVNFDSNVFLYVEKSLLELCGILPPEPPPQDRSKSDSNTSSPTTTNTKTTTKFISLTTLGSTNLPQGISTLPTQNGKNSSDMLITQPSQLDKSNFNETLSTVIDSRFSMEYLKIIKELTESKKCPKYIHKHIGLDLYILNEVSENFKTNSNKDPYTIQSFVMSTLSGLTLVFPQSSQAEYKDLFHSPWTSAIFQRTFDAENQIILYTEPKPDVPDLRAIKRGPPKMKAASKYLKLFKAYRSAANTQDLPIGVIGVSVNQEKIVEMLQKNPSCSKESRVCYLLEDAGIIAAVNEKALMNQIGYFYGDIEPYIMQKLLNESVFSRTVEYDFQASCPRKTETPEKSAGNMLRFMNNLASLSIEIIKTFLVYIQGIAYILQIVIHSMLFNSITAQEATATDNINISCIKKGFRYYLSDQPKSFSLDIQCQSCNLTVDIVKRKYSNYLLISYDNICTSQICKENIQKPLLRKSVKDIGPDLCELSKTPKYRSRANHRCYPFDKNKKFTRCSTNQIRKNYFILLLFIIIGVQHY